MSQPAPPELQITPYNPADVSKLARFAVQAYCDTYGFDLDDQMREQEEAARAAQFADYVAEGDTIFTAKLGDDIVGYAQFGDPRPPILPNAVEMRKWYVAKNLHGQGIGRRLIETAMAHPRLQAARMMCLWVWGGNEAAVQTYTRYGFEAITARDYLGPDSRPTFDLFLAAFLPLKK